MTKTLKQKIEEAANDYGSGPIPHAYESFIDGAQFLLDEGVRFTKEDMAEFAVWFSRNWDLDFKADQGLEVWLKERESK